MIGCSLGGVCLLSQPSVVPRLGEVVGAVASATACNSRGIHPGFLCFAGVVGWQPRHLATHRFRRPPATIRFRCRMVLAARVPFKKQ